MEETTLPITLTSTENTDSTIVPVLAVIISLLVIMLIFGIYYCIVVRKKRLHNKESHDFGFNVVSSGKSTDSNTKKSSALEESPSKLAMKKGTDKALSTDKKANVNDDSGYEHIPPIVLQDNEDDKKINDIPNKISTLDKEACNKKEPAKVIPTIEVRETKFAKAYKQNCRRVQSKTSTPTKAKAQKRHKRRTPKKKSTPAAYVDINDIKLFKGVLPSPPETPNLSLPELETSPEGSEKEPSPVVCETPVSTSGPSAVGSKTPLSKSGVEISLATGKVTTPKSNKNVTIKTPETSITKKSLTTNKVSVMKTTTPITNKVPASKIAQVIFYDALDADKVVNVYCIYAFIILIIYVVFLC